MPDFTQSVPVLRAQAAIPLLRMHCNVNHAWEHARGALDPPLGKTKAKAPIVPDTERRVSRHNDCTAGG